MHQYYALTFKLIHIPLADLITITGQYACFIHSGSSYGYCLNFNDSVTGSLPCPNEFAVISISALETLQDTNWCVCVCMYAVRGSPLVLCANTDLLVKPDWI